MFWVWWGVDALIAGTLLVFFFWGLSDGSVSVFNIQLWLVILIGVAGVVLGSLRFRSIGRSRLATGVALVLAVPGLLAGLFFLVLILSNPRWN